MSGSELSEALQQALLDSQGPKPKDEDLLPPPTYEHVLLQLPLYAPVAVNDREFLKVLRGGGNFQIDAHCVACKRDSVFKTTRALGSGSGRSTKLNWMYESGLSSAILTCQRNGSHVYIFNFYYDGTSLIKYGQMPSLEDISGQDILRYKNLLPAEYFSELKRANGLASHGIGIGSFVYLRRIFERLVDQHRVYYESEKGEIEGFETLRMDEKIAALKSVLPPALVENRAAYAILSTGIHALDEDTCRSYFPVVRQAIIAILEQDRAKKSQEEEAAKLRRELSFIAGNLKAGSKSRSKKV